MYISLISFLLFLFILNIYSNDIKIDIDSTTTTNSNSNSISNSNIDIKLDLSVSDIITSYTIESENMKLNKYENKMILGYITNWNNKGYLYSQKYYKKFTHISPVWYNIEIKNGKLLLNNDINIDEIIKIYGGELNTIQNGPKIIPRFNFNEWTVQQYESLRKTKVQDKVIKIIVDAIKLNHFHGAVIECAFAWTRINQDYREDLNLFIKRLGNKIHEIPNAIMVLVAMPCI